MDAMVQQKKWFFSIAAGLFFACALFAESRARLVGAERLTAFQELPYLDEGVYARQVSSTDRDGYNSDGWYGTYSYLYADSKGEYVLFDEKRPGCIYRLWMTYSPNSMETNRLRIYFDGESTPRVDMPIGRFFSGTNAPFLFPLVGGENKSSGGYFCYVPFPFKQSCKVTMTGTNQPFYYNITYHTYDSNEGVESWTGAEDLSVARQMWSNTGIDPKTNAGVPFVVQGSVEIPAHETRTLLDVTNAGFISSVKIDPFPASGDILSNVWIKMFWDGAEVPQVRAPTGEFFGSGFGEVEVRSLPIGMSSTNAYYCYFPMPFWTNARIQIENSGSVNLSNLTYEVQYSTNRYDQTYAGHFYTKANRSSFTNDGRDYILLDEAGRGQMVGCVLSMRCTETNHAIDMRYLEGDERIYIDQSATPALIGTGTEDYFNGGWYFSKGPFSLACHGAPYLYQEHPGSDATLAYRFHLSDVIPFRSHIRFGIEHGDCSTYWNLSGTYSSVVYYYKKSEPGLVLSAELDVGSPASEQQYSYAADGAATGTNGWYYEGDDDDIRITDNGRSGAGQYSFSVPLAVTNQGVVLRRRTDQGRAPQAGDVFLSGSFVGTWYLPDVNYSGVNKRWRDSEFCIPWEYTAGKTNLNIRISATNGDWNEYRYQVYSVVPLHASPDMDADGMPDQWEGVYFANIRSALPGQDGDADGYSNLEEYIFGSDPLREQSVFRTEAFVVSDAGSTCWVLKWPSIPGRVYSICWSSNLMNGFQTLEDNILWTQNGFTDAVHRTEDNGYYRIKVRLSP